MSFIFSLNLLTLCATKHFSVVLLCSRFNPTILHHLTNIFSLCDASLSFPLFKFQPRLAVSKGLIKPASEAVSGVEASPTKGGSSGRGAQQHQTAGAGADPAVIRYRHRSSIPVRSVVNTG